jgi:hypothetical protein
MNEILLASTSEIVMVVVVSFCKISSYIGRVSRFSRQAFCQYGMLYP